MKRALVVQSQQGPWLSSNTLSHWTILSTGAYPSLYNRIYRLHPQLNRQASAEGCVSQQS